MQIPFSPSAITVIYIRRRCAIWMSFLRLKPTTSWQDQSGIHNLWTWAKQHILQSFVFWKHWWLSCYGWYLIFGSDDACKATSLPPPHLRGKHYQKDWLWWLVPHWCFSRADRGGKPPKLWESLPVTYDVMGQQSWGTLSVRLKGNRRRQVEKQRPRAS